MVLAGAVLGGGTGVVIGSAISKLFPRFKQSLSASLVLGITGYWVGAYFSSAVLQLITGNRGVVNIYLIAALIGAAVVTAIGSVTTARLRTTFVQQAATED